MQFLISPERIHAPVESSRGRVYGPVQGDGNPFTFQPDRRLGDAKGRRQMREPKRKNVYPHTEELVA